jgi:hypothetical protein
MRSAGCAMMRAMRCPTSLAGTLLPLLLLPACASSTPAAASPATEASATPAATAAPSAAPSVAATPPEPTALQQRPLDLTSACPHDVHLFYGAHPGPGAGESAVVAKGATLAVPRLPDGTQMVWVIDEKGNGLASVNVSKRMRHIRIDAACMHIDADSAAAPER